MKIISVLGLVGIAACQPMAAPPEAEQFVPPTEWRVLWEKMESCSGVKADFNQVKWYRAIDPMAEEGRSYYWLHQIYLGPKVVDSNSPATQWYKDLVIQHEMVHELEQTDQHPPVFDSCEVRGTS